MSFRRRIDKFLICLPPWYRDFDMVLMFGLCFGVRVLGCVSVLYVFAFISIELIANSGKIERFSKNMHTASYRRIMDCITHPYNIHLASSHSIKVSEYNEIRFVDQSTRHWFHPMDACNASCYRYKICFHSIKMASVRFFCCCFCSFYIVIRRVVFVVVVVSVGFVRVHNNKREKLWTIHVLGGNSFASDKL